MAAEQRLRLTDSVPPEVVVHDVPSPCAYLPGQTWRLPLRLPLRTLSRQELDQRLAGGDRRQGRLLYRPTCPECQACIPLRIDVTSFEPSRTQRRTLGRGDKLVTVDWGPLDVTPERLRLYNRHKELRGLSIEEHETDAESYALVLGDSCCESFELRYSLGDELVGVAVTDRGEQSLSAVYCYYEPEHGKLSLGTYSILKQIELCRSWGCRYLYLGLYIAECRAMTYKAGFLPHEQLLAGGWTRVDRPG
jgi:arginine-tRNA-protein transferase